MQSLHSLAHHLLTEGRVSRAYLSLIMRAAAIQNEKEDGANVEDADKEHRGIIKACFQQY
jgi:hypothetical protein